MADAQPPYRKEAERKQPQLDAVKEFIDAILEANQRAPRKQRHAAHRIHLRIRREKPEATVSESRVRRYVAWKPHPLGRYMASNDPELKPRRRRPHREGSIAETGWFLEMGRFARLDLHSREHSKGQVSSNDS